MFDALNHCATAAIKHAIRNIWHSYRLNNVNHLAKRKLKNMPGEDGKQKIVYSGIGKVVVAGRTPVIMTYNIKKKRVHS